MAALPDDQEEFLAHELAKGAGQADAWINAGYSAKNKNVASTQCNRLLKKKPEITERAEELKSIAREEALNAEFVASVDNIAKMYLDDRLMARQEKQISAAIQATNGIVKLYGLGSENVNHGASADLAKFLDSISGQSRLSNGDS